MCQECKPTLGKGGLTTCSAEQTFNAAVSKMVTWILWTSPVGVASLIAAAICRACSLWGTLGALGLWVLTVVRLSARHDLETLRHA